MSEVRKLISVVGPTASGKTSFALNLAEQMLVKNEVAGVDLVSADSRQIYRVFEILSGADLGDFLERGFIWEKSSYIHPFLTTIDRKLTLHGVSILDLKSEWNLAYFYEMTQEIIAQAKAANRQVILVGGTMLYHDHILQNNEQIKIPPDSKWREQAQKMTLEELQEKLAELDNETWEKLNNSDRANPRRLIRKIEVATAKKAMELENENQKNENITQDINPEIIEHQYLMPKFDLETLKNKISQRVSLRFRGGAVDEVKKALKILGGKINDMSIFPLGFEEIFHYINGEIEAKACVDAWSLKEWQYAKRQMTWWRTAGLIKENEKTTIIEKEIAEKEIVEK